MNFEELLNSLRYLSDKLDDMHDMVIVDDTIVFLLETKRLSEKVSEQFNTTKNTLRR